MRVRVCRQYSYECFVMFDDFSSGCKLDLLVYILVLVMKCIVMFQVQVEQRHSDVLYTALWRFAVGATLVENKIPILSGC